MFTTRLAFIGLLICLIAPLHAARAETISVADWQTSGNPFARSESLGGLSIATVAELNHQSGARVNMTWSCAKSGTNLAVGISNGDLDYSPVNNKLPLQLKIGSGAVTSFSVIPDSPRRFVINEHLDPRALFANDTANIYKASYLYVGFPANGEDLALRINFQDSGVRQFMTACLSTLQGHGEKKQVQAEINHLQSELDQIAPPQTVTQAPAQPPAVQPVATPVIAKPMAEPVPVVDQPMVTQVMTKPAAQPIPVVYQPAATQPPVSLSASTQVEMKPIPPVEDPEAEQTPVSPKNKSARWKELGKYNLSPGEEMALRNEYTPGTTRIRIGALYRDIPHSSEEETNLKTGEVTLGADHAAGLLTALTIVDVHRDQEGLDDWYRVKVDCVGCAPDAVLPNGWVAASDLMSWRDDPLCVRGTKDCD
jgi:hypothetical protein